MIHEDDLGHRYYTSLDEAKEDGYSPVKATTALCFYRMRGRTKEICKANIEPIPGLTYVIFRGCDGTYEIHEFRGYTLDNLFFYKSSDIEVQHFRKYVEDGTVTILFTAEQVADMTEMLTRVYQHKNSGEGKLLYKDWLRLLEEIVNLEDYRSYAANHTGFKTIEHLKVTRIQELWQLAYEKNQKN